MASKGQIRTLRSLQREVIPDDDAYRAWLQKTFPGKQWKNPERPSTKDLTNAEADTGIRALLDAKGRQVERPWEGRYHGSGRGGRLGQRQADEIARLEEELGWWGQPRRLQGFIRKQVPRVRAMPPNATALVSALYQVEASHIITGLRAFLEDSTPAERRAQQHDHQPERGGAA